MYNIFQGNKLILKKIAEVWGYDTSDKALIASMTFDIFYESFFYLTQRFGPLKKYDKYRDAGCWNFKVDEFQIQLRLNASYLIPIIFGDSRYKDIGRLTPYSVKSKRRLRDKRDKYVNLFADKMTANERKIVKEQWSIFCEKQGIDINCSKEIYNEKLEDWIYHLEMYNDRVLDVDYAFMMEQYGRTYQNKRTKKALRILEKFLKNMLTPISVRDCNYNIKGRCGCEYNSYIGNIDIKFIK